jgi:hypothetical protein
MSGPNFSDKMHDAILADVGSKLQKYTFSQEELLGLRRLIEMRLEYRTCVNCGKNKLKGEGDYVHLNMDLSVPKRFVCSDCKLKV